MIQTWSQLSLSARQELLPELRDIFFTSSTRQNFTDDEQRENFWRRWTDYYFDQHEDLLFVSRAEKRLAGYLMACPDSRQAEPILSKKNPSFSLFNDQFDAYPAHLHINMSTEFRGQGLGQKLIETLCRELERRHCPGLHLITSPAARNVRFYQQNRFDYSLVRDWKGQPLLFMGRRLQT
ncbi:MAG: GNAT family N-acetyltransferase [Bdellovibrionales bacterium]